MGVELEKTCLVQGDLAAISTMSGHVLALLERCNGLAIALQPLQSSIQPLS